MINRSPANLTMLREHVRSIYRHRSKIVAYNVVVLILATAVLLFWPRQYRSEAKLWIKLGRENAKLDPTAATGKTIAITESDREDEIKSVIDVVGSRGVIERAVEQLGAPVVLGDQALPGEDESSRSNPLASAVGRVLGSAIALVKSIDPISDHEEAVKEISKHLRAQAERKSNVVSVIYETDSPHLAQAVIAAVMDQFKQEYARIHATEGSEEFLDSQLQTLRERVEQLSLKLKTAKDQAGFASIDGQRAMLEMKAQSVAAAKLDTSRKLVEAQALESELQLQLQQHPQTIKSEERVIPNTGRDLIRDRLYALQVERMELASRHNNHPRLKEILNQEKEARSELELHISEDRSIQTNALNTVYQTLALELARVRSTVAGYQNTFKELLEQEQQVLQDFRQYNEAEIAIRELERDVQVAAENYMTYATNLEDARLDSELNRQAISNLSVAQSPTLEEDPVSPSKLVLLILTMGAMVAGSIAIIAGMSMIDDSVNRQTEVAETMVDVPFILSVPDRREFRHILK